MKAWKRSPADVLLFAALALGTLGGGLLGIGRFGPAVFQPPLVLGHAGLAGAILTLVYRQTLIQLKPVHIRTRLGGR